MNQTDNNISITFYHWMLSDPLVGFSRAYSKGLQSHQMSSQPSQVCFLQPGFVCANG